MLGIIISTEWRQNHFVQQTTEKQKLKLATKGPAKEHAAAVMIGEEDRKVRQVRCDLAISNHVATALGAGFIPVPFADFLTVTGVQIDLLYRLCKVYDTGFSTEAARSVVTSLVGASVPSISATFLASALKMVPGVGTVVGWGAMPVLAGATTYAVGKVFVEHLESGGTLLTFDSDKMKAHFESAMVEGKKFVAKVKRNDADAAPVAEA
jgi:uncharacterized protein (DUF697 family)